MAQDLVAVGDRIAPLVVAPGLAMQEHASGTVPCPPAILRSLSATRRGAESHR